MVAGLLDLHDTLIHVCCWFAPSWAEPACSRYAPVRATGLACLGVVVRCSWREEYLDVCQEGGFLAMVGQRHGMPFVLANPPWLAIPPAMSPDIITRPNFRTPPLGLLQRGHVPRPPLSDPSPLWVQVAPAS